MGVCIMDLVEESSCAEEVGGEVEPVSGGRLETMPVLATTEEQQAGSPGFPGVSSKPWKSC